MRQREIRGRRNLAGFVPGFVFLFLLVPAGVAQHPRPEPPADPVMTPKQQREWLQWNHRRVQRDIRRLTELAQEMNEQASKLSQEELTPPQRQRLDVVMQQVIALNREFEKTNPHILSLSVVGYAEGIEEETKSFRESLGLTNPTASPLARLRHLCEEIEQRAKRVRDRLRQP